MVDAPATATGPGPGSPGESDGTAPPPSTDRLQPRWTTPLLVLILVGTAVLTGWRAGSSLELYYAASVRSMTRSWHNFAFAAFDPSGTISIDKLPGAFWPQALSARLFGIHPWALAAPQVVEGVLSVLVLFLVVRRLQGPTAALLASGLLAVAPASTALNRGNISDSLLILLLLVAARMLVAALDHPSILRIALVGVVVGLAFQTKMVEAWLALPILGLTYLVCAPVALRRRLLHLGVFAVVGVVVSLSWMTVVTLVPAHNRPYVDGSTHNSLFQQVFDYNGIGRVGQPSPNQQLATTLGLPVLDITGPGAGPTRLLTDTYGRDIGWLLPAAVVLGAACAVWCRGRRRTDRLVVSTLLFGSWLVVFTVLFSVTAGFNAYYLAALDPPIAALVAIGLVLAWRSRRSRSTQAVVATTLVLTAVVALHLVPSGGTGVPSGLPVVVVVLGVLALGALVWAGIRRATPSVVGDGGAAVLVVLSLAAVPLVASLSLTVHALGPFDTPFQPTVVTAFTRVFFSPTRNAVGLARIRSARGGAPYLFAAQTSALAAPYIFATGDEVLPIGGYTGNSPAPTVARIRQLVAAGAFHLVLAGPSTDDPRIHWIARHCQDLGSPTGTGGVPGARAIQAYFCLPASASG